MELLNTIFYDEICKQINVRDKNLLVMWLILKDCIISHASIDRFGHWLTLCTLNMHVL